MLQAKGWQLPTELANVDQLLDEPEVLAPRAAVLNPAKGRPSLPLVQVATAVPPEGPVSVAPCRTCVGRYPTASTGGGSAMRLGTLSCCRLYIACTLASQPAPRQIARSLAPHAANIQDNGDL